MSADFAISISDIEAAQQRLAGVARYTPLLDAPQIDALAGRRVFVKAESLQRTGSFKFRGGWNRLSALSPEERARGVVAFSSGNHAQAVAHSAQILGMTAVIIMPADAPTAKIEGTRGYGAEVVLYDRANEDRAAIGARLSAERGLTLVPPFDDPYVMAGQGTCGLEIAEQAAERGVSEAEMLVCCAGGGLSTGIATALADRAPGMLVRSVEPAGFDDFARSLAAGKKCRNASAAGSVQDALLTVEPGDLTFPIAQKLFGAGLAVTDEEALRAVALAWRWLRLALEPGGAAALAAALFHSDELNGDTVIVTASGGNADAALFAEAIQRYSD